MEHSEQLENMDDVKKISLGIEDNEDEDDRRCFDKKPKIKENMTDREYRIAAKIRKYNKYKAKQFNDLWIMLYVLGPEYADAIVKLNPDDIYTLHTSICYAYLNRYDEEFEDDGLKISLMERIRVVSSYKGGYSDDASDENIDDHKKYKDKSENHFKIFEITARRLLNAYFDFIFECKNSLNKFNLSGSSELNVMDYGFISYLLEFETYNDIHYFLDGKYDQVSEEFYNKTYVGLILLGRFHDVDLTKEKIDMIWKERFGKEPLKIRSKQELHDLLE
jgi:hypothetical protein